MSKRYFFIFTLSTFLLTVVWVASNVYHSYATSTIDPLLSTQIEEIPGSFDTSVISGLKSRQIITPDTSTVFTASPTPIEEVEEIFESSDLEPSEQPTPTTTPVEPEQVLEDIFVEEVVEQIQ